MSAEWTLGIANFEVLTSNNVLNAEITALFSEVDRMAGRHRHGYHEYGYAALAKDMAERLDAIGATMPVVERVYEMGWRRVLRQRAELAESGVVRSNADVVPLTFRKWVATMSRLLRAGMVPMPERSFGGARESLPHHGLLRPGYDHDCHHGFPWADTKIWLRAFCAAAPTGARVELDFTDLVTSGYVGGHARYTDKARAEMAAAHLECAPLIVLTEGATDARILREVLRLRRPHLSHLFAFMEFGRGSAAGGASFLSTLARGFASSLVQARVIAIFDNDAAGIAAIKGMPRLPRNVVTSRLPDLHQLRRYPTIGPQGRRHGNVNGRAASLEMYMGTDVLAHAGRLSPVHWTSYDPISQRYQGEVAGKKALHERFSRKLAAAQSGGEEQHDWRGMDAICGHLVRLAQKTAPRAAPSQYLAQSGAFD